MFQVWRHCGKKLARRPSAAVHWHYRHSAKLSTVQETRAYIEGHGFWCGLSLIFYLVQVNSLVLWNMCIVS